MAGAIFGDIGCCTRMRAPIRIAFPAGPDRRIRTVGRQSMARFHRGVALNPAAAEADIQAIRRTGELVAKAVWGRNALPRPDEVRRVTEGLVAAPAGARAALDALPQTPVTYACARFDDAAFYARPTKGAPKVIAFECALDDVAVDGRDFLYTVFQLWDREGTGHLDRVRRTLATLFGEAILPWFDRASRLDRRDQQSARIGLCDLATCDLAVIEAHHRNATAIVGRYGTCFRSAFAVPQKVDPADVVAVEDVAGSFEPPAEVITLQAMLTP
jgi:hypothetical protein